METLMKKDVVLDTDAFNEIDDQFAIAYLLASEKQLNVKAIYAAPFFNHSVSSPQEGTERSYGEILRILDLSGKKNMVQAYKGSMVYLPNDITPVDSEAVRHLIEISKKYNKENPLYVIAIAAATNIASAILLDPTIVNRISVVWLGSNSIGFWSTWEFNLQQDVPAARVLLNSNVPLVILPCGGVVSHFITTGPELRYWLFGKNAVCNYLVKSVEEYVAEKGNMPWSRVIWDVVAVAYLLNNDNEKFVFEKVIKAPYYYNDLSVDYNKNKNNIRYVYEIDRDRIYQDMVKKLVLLGR